MNSLLKTTPFNLTLCGDLTKRYLLEGVTLHVRPDSARVQVILIGEAQATLSRRFS